MHFSSAIVQLKSLVARLALASLSYLTALSQVTLGFLANSAANLAERCGYLAAVATFLFMLAAASQPSLAAPVHANARWPWMNKSLSPEQRANLLIRAMTLDDKIALVHGVSPNPVKAYAGYVPPNLRLGIPALKLADGRAGVGNGAKDVTLLPAPIAAAASWDPALLNAYGRVLGEEEWGKGTNVALGPTIDVVRVPEWGRTFESYGEDPYLNGRMAVAEIKGIQSQGPVADANMYLTMNQETNRGHMNSVADERTLQEIYLPPFRAAIQAGDVGTVMCAYVKTNGVYSCEKPHLLNGFLRKELGFRGWVMSDWGATHSTIAAALAGLDQEMPGDRYYGQALKNAVEKGQVSIENLNAHVRRILVTMFRQGLFDKQQRGDWQADVRTAQHALFSRKVAEQGTVLLKNAHNILPLAGTSSISIAVIGAAGGSEPKPEGGGSSGVIAPYVVSPLEGIRKRAGAGSRVFYADGSNLAEAAKVARSAGLAIVFASAMEAEGTDRPNLELPGNRNLLIFTIAEANPNTIVVLNTGGPVLMPWISQVRGLIEAWYPGQEDGNAIASILFGDANPGGKLTLTFPRTATGIPTATPHQWPGVDGRSIYSEKLDVGYRWYDATGTEP
ncbi:MAG TPA: glycoside hydrolase family 3 C-terminal domain-containing protein, partial [Terriglobia bacterium]|nr:glycoside hydrolase family 3 C-terminal domain-containing protein [Terriglobia bacterium]